VQLVGGRVDGLEGVVEFAVGQESGIAGDVGDVEFEAEAALELGSKWLVWQSPIGSPCHDGRK
jgi:hypothetical protein